MKPECPVCHLNDYVEKLSDISPSDEGHYGILVRTYEGQERFQRDSLREKVAAPLEPINMGSYVRNRLYIAGGVLLFIALFIFSIVNIRLLWLIAFILSILSFAIGYFYHKIYYPKWESRRPEWEVKKRVWKELYYCSKDDLVFDPTTGRLASPEVWDKLVYSR